jgi:hypothetical protein
MILWEWGSHPLLPFASASDNAVSEYWGRDKPDSSRLLVPKIELRVVGEK